MLIVGDLYDSVVSRQKDPQILEVNKSFSENMYLALASEFYRLPFEEAKANKEKYLQKMAFKAPEQIQVFGQRSVAILTQWQIWAKSLPKPEVKKNIISQIASYLGL